jgi:5'-methylthioadenosine phosphorylase
VDVIGMTNLPEARLAREAELCYATLALVTDYDCWHEVEEEVSVDAVLLNLKRNAEAAAATLRQAVRVLPAARRCPCATALATAIITRPPFPAAARRRLGLLLARYDRQTSRPSPARRRSLKERALARPR